MIEFATASAVANFYADYVANNLADILEIEITSSMEKYSAAREAKMDTPYILKMRNAKLRKDLE